MTNHKKSIAFAILIVGAGFIVEHAMAATATPNARPGPAQRVMVIEHSPKAVWPLYSNLCEYKTVMTNEDMRRCGVFNYSNSLVRISSLAPIPAMVVVDLRTIRRDR